ncbi:MAG TPA: alpha-amylase family protein [Nocardioidaceae bacterium]|nr:alpha-amylase family protein [Nocardioidaceae bacterium]
MRTSDTADLWWKTAVIYCLDVETFLDWNGDGVGDFDGVTERVDYLAELGVTCLWLMPFYPTANKDDGYDITDFYGVDPRLGTHGDVVELVRTAHDRGMRVIVDFVVNHTSDKHPWFKSARSSKDSPFRDYYVWRPEPPTEDTSRQVVFPDQEDSIWELDEKTGEYYLHRFYKHQPDLNVANPKVRDEIAKLMGFWLELGISGFRVDAVPFLLGLEGLPDSKAEDFADPHDYLAALRSFLGRRTGDGILLGEVNLPYAEQKKFFGGRDGDELTMMFDFVGMQNMYLSLAREDARPIARTLKRRPRINQDSQWVSFARNHDELTLDKLSDSERQEVFAAFGPDPEMQIYGRGLRRRLPPMLDGDPRRIKMVYSLMFSLPGTPALFYGEEIGMGENLDIPGRLAVRSPMQWGTNRNGGFSTAAPSRLRRPVTAGPFGPEHVNVSAQRADPESLLNFITLLVRRYRESPELGWSDPVILDQPHRNVIAQDSRWQDRRLVTVHNLASERCTVPLQLEDCEPDCVLVDLLQDGHTELDDQGRVELALEGYGYRWLRVMPKESRRLA